MVIRKREQKKGLSSDISLVPAKSVLEARSDVLRSTTEILDR